MAHGPSPPSRYTHFKTSGAISVEFKGCLQHCILREKKDNGSMNIRRALILNVWMN